MPRDNQFEVELNGTQLLRWIPGLVLGLVIVYVLFQGFYTLEPHEQAVVLRFGQYHDTRGPGGLHFKVPLMDQAVVVDTSEQSVRLPFGIGIGDDVNPNNIRQARQDEVLLLTGDLYAGVVEWNVDWRIVEPKDFLFSIAEQDINDTIVAVSRSVMNRVVGDYSADEILTSKREEVRLEAAKEMQEVLDSYQLGVSVIALNMQRVKPPARVLPAFEEVNASIQQKERLINEANQERNKLIPQAEATSDRLVREAEGYAARRRAEAEGEIAALKAKYQAYKEAPDITRQRLYLEAMEEILANVGNKTVLDADMQGLLPLLNLDESTRAKGQGGQP